MSSEPCLEPADTTCMDFDTRGLFGTARYQRLLSSGINTSYINSGSEKFRNVQSKNIFLQLSGWSKYLNQEAPQISQKAPEKAPKSFSLKSACILVKSATDLTPQTIFIAFLCIKLFQLDNFLKFTHEIIGKLFSFYLFYLK